MKLLIITQKVNKDDPILGFFHHWLIGFAKKFDSIHVICLEMGQYELPNNVKVHSLGKEKKESRLLYLYNFYKYIWQFRNEYDAVFVHMNPEYVDLGWPIWLALKKRIYLWYTHRQKNLKLKIASLFVEKIFTASKDSFGIESNKVRIVGHGINTEMFSCPIKNNDTKTVEILHVGRITEIKNCDIIVESLNILKKEIGLDARITFVGGPILNSDRKYMKKILEKISTYGLDDYVRFAGLVPNSETVEYYCRADVTVNLTPTGGLDKTVLESLSCGTPVICSNESYREIFGRYADDFICKYRDADDVSAKIKKIIDVQSKGKIQSDLRNIALENASDLQIISKITQEII